MFAIMSRIRRCRLIRDLILARSDRLSSPSNSLALESMRANPAIVLINASSSRTRVDSLACAAIRPSKWYILRRFSFSCYSARLLSSMQIVAFTSSCCSDWCSRRQCRVQGQSALRPIWPGSPGPARPSRAAATRKVRGKSNSVL